MQFRPKTVLITGASSGLGKALAKRYAKEKLEIYITGRDEVRLEGVKQECLQSGAIAVHKKCVDIKHPKLLHKWLEEIKNNIDMVIANAGISAGTGGIGESYEQVKNIFDTNIYGVLNTIYPVMEIMRQKKRGQIVIISSLAGYRGLPSSPAYSASKAAVKVYGEALRGFLAKDNVGVTVVTPGYIKTPMTDVNTFPMPCLMEADEAADKIVTKLYKNPARIAFPFPLYFAIWLISTLPPWLVDPIMSRLPAKPAAKQQEKYEEQGKREL